MCSLVFLAGPCQSQADPDNGMQPSQDLLNPDTSDAVVGLDVVTILRSLRSPVHWKNFSILSFSAYEGYDTNTNLQQLPIGSSLTALNALAIYSAEFSHTRLDLQYHPFYWFSPKRTYKDFGSAAADLATTRPISPHWRVTLADSFHYSPSEESTIEGQSYGADFNQGLTVGTPFLSTGWNVLNNDVRLQFEDRYSEYSSVEVHADQGFVRVSELPGASVALLAPFAYPTQELLTWGGGADWTDRLSARNNLDVRLDYRKQSSLGTSQGDGEYTILTGGLAHLITPSFRIIAKAGPGWHSAYSLSSGNAHLLTTVQGFVEAFKQFQKGGIAASFNRSDAFTGVIGNGFNNRVDLTVDRHLSTHWSAIATGSYLEQGVGDGKRLTGKFASAELDYFVTRNWSLFLQGRYLGIRNGSPLFAPEKIATVGFRWAWVPEKP
jgi:hypothetical protein